jgi:AraC-like DNA-binding protein
VSPRERLADLLIDDGTDFHAGHELTGAGALTVALAYHLMRRLGDREPDASRDARLLDVLSVALEWRLGGVAALPRATRRRALLAGVQAFIEQRLADPALSPGRIAAANHISVRLLHKLFETQETTVAAWVRQRRLERCRLDLLDPALARRPVQAIGARWGLPDAAHFSRLFRAAYGLPPGRYRLLAAAAPGSAA